MVAVEGNAGDVQFFSIVSIVARQEALLSVLKTLGRGEGTVVLQRISTRTMGRRDPRLEPLPRYPNGLTCSASKKAEQLLLSAPHLGYKKTSSSCNIRHDHRMASLSSMLNSSIVPLRASSSSRNVKFYISTSQIDFTQLHSSWKNCAHDSVLTLQLVIISRFLRRSRDRLKRDNDT